MTRRFRDLLIGLLLTTAVAAQDEPFRISIDTTLVSLQVLVQDRVGRAVNGLTREDFEILEEGEPQQISHFAATGAPRSILLMFETSRRTQPQRQWMVSALNAFLGRLRPEDHTAVAGFSHQLDLFMNWRALPLPSRQLDRYLQSTVPISRTPPPAVANLYSSLEDAAQRFANQRGLKAILVMTDGVDATTLEHTFQRGTVLSLAEDTRFQRLVHAIGSSGVPVIVVALRTDLTLDAPDVELAKAYEAAARLRIERLAAETGGRVYVPTTMQDVVAIYDGISSELGLNYTLEYAPTNTAADGTVRKIEVRVRQPGVRVVQSRSGYTATPREAK